MATLTTIANLTGPKGDTGATGSPTAYELRGAGSPQGVVTASPGTYYTDTAGTLGAWRWLKTTGTGTTGWVVVDGDTGRRDITNLLVNGWTASSFRIERSIRTVSFAIVGLTAAAATSGTFLNTAALAGFTPMTPTTGFIGINSIGTITRRMAWGSIAAQQSSDVLEVQGCFVTGDAWPTVLPGTAV